MSKEEFKKRFLKHFTDLGIDKDVAECEWEAYEQDTYDENDPEQPEYAAAECLSYWGE